MKYVPRAEEQAFEETGHFIRTLLPKNIKGNLLDIGCYKCYLQKHLPLAIRYQGLDLDQWTNDVIKCDLNEERIPFDDNSFDFIVCLNVIEHLLYPEKALKEIERILKPEGTAIISLPNDNGVCSRITNLFQSISDFDKQKHSHHWKFSISTATSLVSKYFNIKKIKMNNGYILKHLDFILLKFPNICSDTYFVCDSK